MIWHGAKIVGIGIQDEGAMEAYIDCFLRFQQMLLLHF